MLIAAKALERGKNPPPLLVLHEGYDSILVSYDLNCDCEVVARFDCEKCIPVSLVHPLACTLNIRIG